MWLDPSLYGPRKQYATENGATYPKGRSRIQWGTDERVYRGWQLHDKENHLERSLQTKLILRWEAKLDYTWDHIEGLACQWFGEYGQDTSPVLHLALQLIPPLRNTDSILRKLNNHLWSASFRWLWELLLSHVNCELKISTCLAHSFRNRISRFR